MPRSLCVALSVNFQSAASVAGGVASTVAQVKGSALAVAATAADEQEQDDPNSVIAPAAAAATAITREQSQQDDHKNQVIRVVAAFHR